MLIPTDLIAQAERAVVYPTRASGSDLPQELLSTTAQLT